MSDHNHPHQNHRPHRLSVPPRGPSTITSTTTARSYPLYPYSSSTPTPTPSKQRLSSIPSISNKSPTNSNSFSSLFLLLFSLRSLYSLLPFLRSSPAFSLFPFSFLVSLFSLLLTFSVSLFSSSSSSSSHKQNTHNPLYSLTQFSQSQLHLLIAKSILLAIVFLLRFQALRYCGTAATILAELSGNVAARFITEGSNNRRRAGYGDRNFPSKVRGFFALFVGLLLLSISWDRVECFPLSALNVGKVGFLVPGGNCLRVWPMLLPFLSGFLGSYERVSMNWGSIKQLGRKRVRVISLFFTTIMLFFPALISFFMFEEDGDGVSIGNLGWPLVNIVVFGVLLSGNYGDEKSVSSYQREFVATFVCTLVLELFYFPELSLWGLLFCGFLLWVAVRELDTVSLKYPQLGVDSSDSFSSMIMRPIKHILSERKSRKIALFLFINTAYMVVEFVVGFMSNSLGLISDACHMLFDCAALAIGLYASYISRFPANSQFNYGRGRFEVLSGYVNAVLLVLVGALIVLESLERILDPQEISTSSLLTVSIGGLVVNVVGLIFFHEEHHHAHGGAGTCSHSHSHSVQHHHHDLTVHDHTHGGGGASGACSHSHSHSHLHAPSHTDPHHHHDHSHDLVVHDHFHGEPHECISVSHEKSHGCHDSHCSDHTHHDHHGSDHHEHHENRQNIGGSTGLHNHQCQDDHQDHRHQHDCHDNSHHHHAHDAHQNSIRSSSSNPTHSHEGHSHGNSHTHSGCCSHTYNPSSTHTHSNKSDVHSQCSHSSSHSKQPPSANELLKEPKKQHRHVDHNMEGIFLHVLADTLGSVGVVVSTLLIKYKGWLVADPACSIILSILIISSVIPLLRNTAEVLLQRVPRAHEQDLKMALEGVASVTGVHSIENMHVWSFTNTDVVGTFHLRVSPDADKASTKAQVSHILHNAGIKDLTIQMDCVRNT